MKAIIQHHKWLWIAGSVVLVAGLLILVISRSRRSSLAAPAAAGERETALAFIGDLAESATASGQVEAGREARLSLGLSTNAASQSNIVHKVHVAVGDTVNAGDILVELDSAALERAIASAEQDVAIARAELADLLAGPSGEDVASAEAAVANAQAQLDDLLDGPSEEEIAASEASVQAAYANVQSAAAQLDATNNDVNEADIMTAEANLDAALEEQQSAHDMWVRLADCETDKRGNYVCTPTTSEAMETATRNVELANAKVAQAQAQLDELRNPDAHSVDSSQANLAKAQAQYDASVARHDALLLGASDADIASAEADLASAKASLASLLAGPTATDLKIHQIRVAQAEIDLQEARNALADAILVAPFDGVVTGIHVKEGERASGVAVELVDTQRLEVVLNVDEVDLNRIEVGQSAIVTLESWPNVEIEGYIAAIAPSATDNSSGIVSYEVHVRLEPTTEIPIRVGMTANADLITTRRKDVLLVPNAAIMADRQAGVYRVNLVRTTSEGDQTPTPVEVTIGARDNEYTQITSGLSEGDEVLLGTLSAPSQPEFGPPGHRGGFSG